MVLSSGSPVSSAHRVQLGAKRLRIANGHVGCIEKTLPCCSSLPIGVRQGAVDRVEHHRCKRHATLPRDGRDPSMALVVDLDLHAML